MQQVPQPPQVGMMPSPNGIGMIPMALTSNPALKCFINDCNYVGTGICKWNNCCLRKKKRNGCGRRYCYNHKNDKTQVIPTKNSSFV